MVFKSKADVRRKEELRRKAKLKKLENNIDIAAEELKKKRERKLRETFGIHELSEEDRKKAKEIMKDISPEKNYKLTKYGLKPPLQRR